MKFQRKYFYNDNYFEQIDSEEKAYWVGFLYGDGHISDNTVTIFLQSKDKAHLQKFLVAIDAQNVPINDDAKPGESGITLCSKIFIHHLQKLGFVHNKTYEKSDVVFKNIPNIYKRDFIRGYWDADGCVGSYTKQECYTEVVSLNEVMLNTISNYLNNYFNDPNFCKVSISNNKYSRIRLGSDKAIKLCSYLYKDSIVYLDRKYEHYLKFRPITKNYYNIRIRE